MVVALAQKIYVIEEVHDFRWRETWGGVGHWEEVNTTEQTTMIGFTGDLNYAAWKTIRFWSDPDDTETNGLLFKPPGPNYMSLLGL